MTTTTITIGWTRSDLAIGYSSFSDGYRPGASQHVETITVDVPDELDQCLIAEAVFIATNAPSLQKEDGLAHVIAEAIDATGFDGRGAHYSLSVGDTVTCRKVDGTGDTTLACENTGWRTVA